MFKIVYNDKDQKLLIAECLKMHETTHLKGLNDVAAAENVPLPVQEKKHVVGDNQRPDVVPLEAL